MATRLPFRGSVTALQTPNTANVMYMKLQLIAAADTYLTRHFLTQSAMCA